ncbi:hypothetical protein HOF56_03775 [Candidatus Peribacteria bacterium]|jgi:hypothetical protein|nr:hypothetical protein [Candidatus Peribacteria bacterium]MBT4020910.1 hypothetical protein [Candidatus Peribacteria bacterium]MBT4240648.1 hypothetical protein [Candidatus Peribacteria bacterium]
MLNIKSLIAVAIALPLFAGQTMISFAQETEEKESYFKPHFFQRELTEEDKEKMEEIREEKIEKFRTKCESLDADDERKEKCLSRIEKIEENPTMRIGRRRGKMPKGFERPEGIDGESKSGNRGTKGRGVERLAKMRLIREFNENCTDVSSDDERSQCLLNTRLQVLNEISQELREAMDKLDEEDMIRRPRTGTNNM